MPCGNDSSKTFIAQGLCMADVHSVRLLTLMKKKVKESEMWISLLLTSDNFIESLFRHRVKS